MMSPSTPQLPEEPLWLKRNAAAPGFTVFLSAQWWRKGYVYGRPEKDLGWQNQIFRHANYDPTAYYAYRNKYYKLKSGQTYEPLSLTYQPLTLQGKGLERLQNIQYKSAWYSNGAAAHALYLTVMHRAEDNGMNFNFEHQTGVVHFEDLQYLYYYLCRIIFKGVENPDMTVGEIIESV